MPTAIQWGMLHSVNVPTALQRLMKVVVKVVAKNGYTRSNRMGNAASKFPTNRMASDAFHAAIKTLII